jgi:hypothetical protein
MKNECLQLYQEMLNETGIKDPRQSYFPKWVEHHFRVCVVANMRLQKMIENYSFADEQEERWFFKTLKPQFSGLVEYFTLVYTAELFIPEDPARRMEYWNRELGKTWKFLMKHEEFYLAYKRGLTQETPDDKRTSGSYGNLAAMIIAREKYMEYIQGKLTELRGRRQNSLLLRA